jgi:hypothetical protein
MHRPYEMPCSGKKGYFMLESIFFYGGLAVVVLFAIISTVVFMRHRRISAKLMKSADLMESRVYKAVAEKYGVTPNLIAECLAPEREAIFAAMTRCDSCGSVEECRHFFDQPESDVDEAREFCPNAGLFIDLADFAEKQR